MGYNPIIIWLLYSPLHWIMSGMTMIIQYKGRRSGKDYQLPVGYLRNGDTLLTVSFRRRTWWRNLRGGAPVRLRLEGMDFNGFSEVIEDQAGVMEGLRKFIARDPRTARMMKIILDNNGQPEVESLSRAASVRVMVQTKLA